jgi:hypothetical protein
MLKKNRSILILLATVAGGACYDQILVPGDEGDGRIEITNDEFVLDRRVDHVDEDLPLDSSMLPAAFAQMRAMAFAAAEGPALAPSSISLRLIAEARPPSIAGQEVQATAIWMTGKDKAVVSYNFRGNPAIGALDYFDRVDEDDGPRLRSSATFADADVNAVTIDSKWAYAAMLSSDETLPSSAVVERIQFKGNKFTLDGNLQRPLASFAATSVVSVGSIIYATSGDAGSVYALAESDLSIIGEYPLADARWVAYDADSDRIVVAQGTPGRLSVFEEGAFPGGSMNLINTFSFPGADVPESKSTVEVVGGKAFIAAGPEGVQIVCLDTGVILGSVPIPDPAALGLDPSVVVTNSVTVDDDLMFISNGEAGIYAAAAPDDFDKSGCTAQDVTVLGRVRFDDLQSANHVIYRGGELIVAAGLGGIKVVDVRVR